jgi:enterochelin esterase-like enzyme
VKELKPYIDRHFSTLRDQQHTFIAGSSMGGLVSMYAICEYPKVFGGATCMSTHWPGTFSTENNPIPAAFLQYLKTHLPSPKNHKIYFDYGSETLDAMYKPYQMQADDIMKAAGYTEASWITREFPGANHSEKSRRKRLDVPVLFLLKKTP